MTERYALFIHDEYEAEGGVNDLAHIGTMQECVQLAEQSDRHAAAHIATMEDLAIVKTGQWNYTPSPLVGQPITWHYEWLEVTVPA